MNIMVCVKQVIDNAILPTVDKDNVSVVKQGIETMMSPFDQNAVEAALKIVEEKGGEVSVITMGDESSKSVLKIGLAMGAEHAYLINDEKLEHSDTWTTSHVLAKAIKHIGEFDLILCGKQAIDGDTGQVGGGIAEQLDISQLTYVEEIQEVADDKIIVKRVSSSGEELVEAKLPCLLTCEKSLNEPRYPTLKRTRKANRMEIPNLTCQDIGVEIDADFPCKIQKLYTPEPRQSGEILTGEASEIAKVAVSKIIDLKIV